MKIREIRHDIFVGEGLHSPGVSMIVPNVKGVPDGVRGWAKGMNTGESANAGTGWMGVVAWSKTGQSGSFVAKGALGTAFGWVRCGDWIRLAGTEAISTRRVGIELRSRA